MDGVTPGMGSGECGEEIAAMVGATGGVEGGGGRRLWASVETSGWKYVRKSA